MCGICGIWYFESERTVNEAVLRSMTQRLAHRGPDDEGCYRSGSLGLGVRRLNVIDAAGSAQPVFSEDQALCLVCNGEIYNYHDLRYQLIPRHKFSTNGDVEAILHLYEDCGVRCIDPLRGMFAFALWDSRVDQLMLAVDRFGKKPLYYLLDAEKLIFASELKSIMCHPGVSREIDDEALDEYFAYGYICAPRTIFKGVRKLSAGQRMIVRRDASADLAEYWHPNFAEPSQWDRRSRADLVAELRSLLIESVRLRMVSDVPLGAFLSGGVDSSAVVALMRQVDAAPVKTFSIGFQEAKYDESPHAQAAADWCHAEHTMRVVRPQDALEWLPRLVEHYDEPLADSSMIPTFLLAQRARQDVTVALSGDGGDEVFAGYHQHLYAYRQAFLQARIPTSLQPAAMRLARVVPRAMKVKPYLAALGRPAHYWLTGGFFSAAQRQLLCDNALPTTAERARLETFRRAARLDGLSQLQYHDLTTYLPGDILAKVDRASMWASLEVRSPLLDHVVFEFMARVPAHHRLSLTTGKTLLKDALGGLLPPAARRKKQGFSIPQSEWLRGSLQPLLRETVLASTSPFNRAYVRQLVDEHTAGVADHGDRLWSLLCFGLWSRGQA